MTKAQIYEAATELDLRLFKLDEAIREVRRAAEMDSLATAQSAHSQWMRAKELLLSICGETFKTK